MVVWILQWYTIGPNLWDNNEEDTPPPHDTTTIDLDDRPRLDAGHRRPPLLDNQA